MAEMQARACDHCMAQPAVWKDLESDLALCRDCGNYRSGRTHGRADVGVDLLDDAIAELRQAGLASGQLAMLCTQTLDQGVPDRDVRPEKTTAKDPRPFTALLTPLPGGP